MFDPIILADPIERHHPLNRGRIAWYLGLPGLDGGRLLYDSVGSRHGTLTNMAAASGWRGTTRPGGHSHLLFDGTNDQVVSVVPVSTLPFSMTACFRVSALGSYFPVLNNRDDGFVGMLLSGGGGNPLTSSWNGSAGEYAAATGLAVVVGRWYMGASAFATSATVTVLVDLASGVASSYTLAATNAPRSVASWKVGADLGGPYYWVGAIDDVSFWDRALSVGEVRALAEESRLGYPGTLRRRRRGRAHLSPMVGPTFRRTGGPRTGTRSVA